MPVCEERLSEAEVTLKRRLHVIVHVLARGTKDVENY